MYKLDLEKAEELEIKWPTSIGSQRKQENSRKKKSTSAPLTTLKPLIVWITTICGKIFKEMGTPDHFTCPEKPVCRIRSNSWNQIQNKEWFRIGKGVCQGCILSPCLFNFYAEYIMRNTWLEEAQAGIKIAGRNINHLRYADDTTLMAESEEELKSLLMKVKRRVNKLA